MITITPTADLREALDRIGKGLGDAATGAYRDLVAEVHWRLSRRTPVLTGRARGNWRVGINRPDMYVDMNAFDPDGANGQAEAREVLRNLQLEDTAYVSNAVPYIWPLNDGHSQKAPAGWIDLTASEIPFLAQQLGRGLADRLHGRSADVGVSPE